MPKARTSTIEGSRIRVLIASPLQLSSLLLALEIHNDEPELSEKFSLFHSVEIKAAGWNKLNQLKCLSTLPRIKFSQFFMLNESCYLVSFELVARISSKRFFFNGIKNQKNTKRILKRFQPREIHDVKWSDRFIAQQLKIWKREFNPAWPRWRFTFCW